MKDFANDALIIGIIDAGIMRRGIAQIAAAAGLKVVLNDVNETATHDAESFVHKMLDMAAEKGRMTTEEAAAGKSNLSISTKLSELAEADMVIEAIIEKLKIKQPLFKELEGIVSEECIIATNTSSLSVTAVATACETQCRIAGCHFFNPVPLMKLIEVIGGIKTEGKIIEQITALIKRLGHTPVNVNDSSGFLVNHMGRDLSTESLQILFEKITEPYIVDTVIRDCVGLRMGAFELMDLTALDVTCPVSEQIYEQYYHDPRLRPTPALKQRYVAGILGKKVGTGYYLYEDGNKINPVDPEPPQLVSTKSFWVSSAILEYADKVLALLKTAGVEIDEGERPERDRINIITPLGLDATTAAIDEALDPERVVAVDALFSNEKRICLMTNPTTLDEVINDTWAAFAKTGSAVSVIKDSAGFIAQRIVANIINTASDIAQQGIARPEDIDTGARFGLGYPKGPLALGDELGVGTILEILENLQVVYGDPRYRPSPWLRRRVMLSLSLLHTDNS